MDGEQLLRTMHDHGNRDSLVYWIEFKDDEDFPAIFGSIAGGSALKFGVYRRNQTGEWMNGSPMAQNKLALSDAIEIARKHRDQLVRGCEILSRLPENATDQDYTTLQREISSVAPDISDSAWGHKYFSLLFPTKLDDYHNPVYQRYHLVRMLVAPPQEAGRYLCAGRFVKIAGILELPLNHLTTILNKRDGNPRRYWRIGTSDGEARRSEWEPMRTRGFVSIGWGNLGDLSVIKQDTESKERVRTLMNSNYPGDPQVTGRNTQQVFNFTAVIAEKDIVVACDGQQIIGIGVVAGGYYYNANDNFPHKRPVTWLSLEEWRMPVAEGLRTTVREIREQVENIIPIEEKIIMNEPVVIPGPSPSEARGPTTVLSPIIQQIQSILERKCQVILCGPPGTGKTYWAEISARELAARHNFNLAYESLDQTQIVKITGTPGMENQLVRMCTFHPSYGYEDFIEGYKPKSASGNMAFELRDGIFKKLCLDAAQNSNSRYFLIIDEINRGDIPRIFGELLTLVEKSKRGKPAILPYSGQRFLVPGNVFIIATMNTADRSIALLDTALRRRFGFIEIMPDYSLLTPVIDGIPIAAWLKALNSRIVGNRGHDARNLQIGHSYFMEGDQSITTMQQFLRILKEDIIPLLQEYFYDNYSMLQQVLGDTLIDRYTMNIRQDLLDGEHNQELSAALLKLNPEAATEAIATEQDAIQQNLSNPDETEYE